MAANEIPEDGDDEPFAGVADDELVHLDRLGAPQRTDTLTGRIVAPELPEASRTRIGELGDITLDEDLTHVAEAALVVVSTRMPRAELTALLARLAEASCPIVALVHTGGESLAVETMRRGGAGVVAEGNEAALAAFLADAETDEVLLDSYDRQIARAESGTRSRGHDPVTALPDRAGFEVRLAGLEQEGEVPRIAFVRVTRTPQVPEELSAEAAALLRRRLARQFLHVCRAHGVELYALQGWDFGLVGLSLSPNAAQYLARDLDHVAETYTPASAAPLGAALGHAGSEVSTDLSTLREAALRAVDAAEADRTTVVVAADTLSLGVSASTELEAALRLVEFVERHGRLPAGHGARVGEIAATIATELGYEGIARSRIQLAGHLHAVGLASLPPEAIADPDGLSGELRNAYRNHPVAGARYLTASAGPEVAAAVRGYRERWDGAGYPDGLQGPDIPVSARVLAAAHAVDELTHATVEGRPMRLDEIAQALRERAEAELDPDIVEVAADVLAELLDRALPMAG